ncbi:MAG: bifunctional 4-hydroxy-2-oxoglutarate aldolase/2-dehydro-3-deoxy-phosphogluconate aldolase [Candidatus Omnitrophota bacterium]
MNRTLQEKLASLIRTGFVPILVDDDFDPFVLCGAVVDAGVPAVEFTLRRNDIENIPLIRKEFPGLSLLIGSTFDHPAMVSFLKKRRTFYSLEELAEMGADGFVSMVPFHAETYRRFAGRKLLIPGVASPGEGIEHLGFGADLIKFVGVSPEYLKMMRSPTHGVIPIFYTGGVTLERIPSYVESGALVMGAGFEVIAGGRQNADRAFFTERLIAYREAIAAARKKTGCGYLSEEQDPAKLLPTTGCYIHEAQTSDSL